MGDVVGESSEYVTYVLSCIYVIKIGFRCNAKNQKTRPADLVFLLLQQWNPWITRAGKGRQAVILKPPICQVWVCPENWLGSPKIYGICQEENSNILSTTKFEVPYVQTNPYYVATPDHPRPPFSFLCSFLVWFTKTSAKYRIHLPSLLSCSLRLTFSAPGETE